MKKTILPADEEMQKRSLIATEGDRLKMSNSFAQWTSILANIATALAVGFAAYQLLLLNRHARVESHARLTQSEREIWTAALQLPSLSEVIRDVWGIEGHKPEEGPFWAIFLDSCEHMLTRYKAGILDADDWSAFDNYIGRLVRCRTFTQAWDSLSGDYSPSFVKYVTTKLPIE